MWKRGIFFQGWVCTCNLCITKGFQNITILEEKEYQSHYNYDVEPCTFQNQKGAERTQWGHMAVARAAYTWHLMIGTENIKGLRVGPSEYIM